MKTVLAVTAALLVAYPLAAESTKEKVKTIGWADLPPKGFPILPARLPRLKAAREKAIAQLDKDRAASLKAVEKLKFYGLCEIESIEPIKTKEDRFLVVAHERQKLRDRGGDQIVAKFGFVHREVAWEIGRDEALELAPRDQLNVSGVISKVTAGGAGKIDDLLVFRVYIDKVKR